MVRRKVLIGLLCVSILLTFGFGQCYEKERIIPSVKVEKDSVIISFTTYYPSTDARLFVTYEDEVEQGMKAFPEYRYTVLDKKEFTNTHQFEIPIAPKKSSRFLRALPVGVTTHFRLSCIMLIDKKARYVRSKDYTFRIIKTKSGEYKPGVCFTRPPVVANVFDKKATIWWETNIPAQTRFYYWREGQKMPSIIEGKDPMRKVEIEIEGLKPETKYYFQVECISPELNDTLISQVKTFYSATQSPHFAFAVMGDSRANPYSSDPDANINGVNVTELNRLCQLAKVSGVRFILFPGDLISGYTEDVSESHLQYATWMDAVAPIASSIPFYPAIGNHDASAPWLTFEGEKGKEEKEEKEKLPFAETLWADVFVLPENGPVAPTSRPPYIENVYSFNYGDCHFVCLNSNYNYIKGAPSDSPEYNNIDEIQREWLKTDLQANLDKKYIFVYFHEPAYPTSVHQKKSLDRLPAERDALWEILDTYNVDVVFCGHEHIYTRLLVDKSVDQRWKNSIWQITCGRAGAPWYPVNKTVPWSDNIKSYNYAPHFTRVEVDGNNVYFKTYDIDGNVVDEFVHKRKKRSSKLLEKKIQEAVSQ